MASNDRSTVGVPGPDPVTRLIHDFEEHWRRGRRPALWKHVPASDDPKRREAVRELVHLDLIYRIRMGDDVPLVELYLQTFPDDLNDPEDRLDLIKTEFQECCRRGDVVRGEDYHERFPALADALASLLTLPWACPHCRRHSEISSAAKEAHVCVHCGETSPPGLSNKSPVEPPPEGVAGLPQVPGYTLLQEHGRGGMGVVYKARQIKLDRVVALKMILAGVYAGREELARFRIEAEAVARLNHPNIVQIYEVGEHDGRPYFTLEFVDSGSLDKKLQHGPTPPQEAALLIATLAHGIHYAHQQGIVHRDLKPANVLLTADGEPKITDFGLAKKLDEQTLTMTGQLLGTPSYMAPEQAGRGATPLLADTQTAGVRQEPTVGPPADVYALGAILYECLTGEPPFKGTSILETLEMVQSSEPMPIRRRQPNVPRDLETICLKCLEKEPARRYSSAEGLAEDLACFLDGRPIQARRVGAVERLWRWCRRNPLIAALLIGIGVLLVISAVGATIAAFQYRAKANVEAKARLDLEKELYASSIAVAERELTLNNDVALASRLLVSEKCPLAMRGWEWHYLMRLRDGQRKPLLGHKGGLWMAEYSPDGRQIATASIDGTVNLWDADTGAIVATYRGHMLPELPFLPAPPRLPVMCLAFSPDGRFIASGSLAPNLADPFNIRKALGVVHVWDVKTKKVTARFEKHLGYIYCLAFSPDGTRIASANTNEDNSFAIWDARTGEELHAFRANASHVHRLRFSPDGKRLLAGHTDGSMTVWDPATFEKIDTIDAHPGPVYELAFSKDGTRFASAGLDGTVRVWDSASGTKTLTLAGHTGVAMGVAFSPDGTRIATAGYDKTVRLWDARTGEEKITLRGHSDTVCSVAFSPDGNQLVSASFDKTARIWDAAPIEEKVGLGLFTLGDHTPGAHTALVNGVSFSQDGRLLATGGWDTTVRLWNAQTGKPVRTLAGHQRVVWRVAFSPDSKRVASASWDRTVKVWDVEADKEVLTFTGHATPVNSLAFSPDGNRVVSSSFEGLVKIWDSQTGQETVSCAGHLFPTFAVAFSPDGQRVASGSGDRTVKIWDANTGKEKRTLTGHDALVHDVAFSPDNQLLASASWDHTAKIWDANTGKELRTLIGHQDRVQTVAFSPDGRWLATASEDKTIRIWEVASGQEAAPSLRHHGVVWAAVFSPDRERIAGVCWSNSSWLKTWRLPGVPKDAMR